MRNRGEFCAVVQDLVRRLSLDPKAPGPIAKKPYSLSAEDMESLERSIDEDFRLELGSVEKVTPAAGDLIGIPLAGGDFALAVLLTAECIGPSPGFPEFWGGVLAIADVMKSQVGEPNDLDPTALRIVKATGAMLGPMRLGEWPVLRAGVNLAGPTFALGLDPFHALRNLRWSERDRRTSQQLA